MDKQYTIEISKTLNEDLDLLADKIKGDKFDVLKKALVLFKIALEATEHNMKFAIVDQDKNIVTEVTGILNS